MLNGPTHEELFIGDPVEEECMDSVSSKKTLSRRDFVAKESVAWAAGALGVLGLVFNFLRGRRQIKSADRYQAEFQKSAPGHDPVLSSRAGQSEVHHG